MEAVPSFAGALPPDQLTGVVQFEFPPMPVQIETCAAALPSDANKPPVKRQKRGRKVMCPIPEKCAILARAIASLTLLCRGGLPRGESRDSGYARRLLNCRETSEGQ